MWKSRSLIQWAATSCRGKVTERLLFQHLSLWGHKQLRERTADNTPACQCCCFILSSCCVQDVWQWRGPVHLPDQRGGADLPEGSRIHAGHRRAAQEGPAGDGEEQQGETWTFLSGVSSRAETDSSSHSNMKERVTAARNHKKMDVKRKASLTANKCLKKCVLISRKEHKLREDFRKLWCVSYVMLL